MTVSRESGAVDDKTAGVAYCSSSMLLLLLLVALAASTSALTATLYNNISRVDVDGNVVDC